MPRPSKRDTEILQAALIGFQHMRNQVEEKIEELRSRIGGGATFATGANGTSLATKRSLSPAARRRIAAAQKKRWAAYKAKHHRTPSARPKKRVLSAAGRARIVAATKKRWAAYRKAHQSA
jgi:hypothetical protein